MSFPKNKPPHSVKVLHNWIATYAKETGQVPERIMRSVSYMIASLALERARDESGGPLFLIKGGVMIEMRLGLRARATRDLDAVFRAEFRSWLDQLDGAIRRPVGDFTLTRTEPEQIKRTNTKRLQLIIDYRGKRWAQIPLEVAPAEVPDVLEIEHVGPLHIAQLGLPEPASVAVVGPGYQIAQKLHACTERFKTGPENDRFRDLMDLLLLRDVLTDTDLPRVREACVRIFEARKKHSWPPTVTVYESWRASYREMALDRQHQIGRALVSRGPDKWGVVTRTDGGVSVGRNGEWRFFAPVSLPRAIQMLTTLADRPLRARPVRCRLDGACGRT